MSGMAWVGRVAAALAPPAVALTLLAAPVGAAGPPSLSIRSEYLVFTPAAGGGAVDVFEDVALASTPRTWWQFPLPVGAYGVHPKAGRLRRAQGHFLVAPGETTAAVVYRLNVPFGAAYVQNSDVPVGRVMVLAGAGVYPGVQTGLTLRGLTQVDRHPFKVFVGGANGPGGVLHFSLTVGNPGIAWADGIAVLLSVWLAFGAAAAVVGIRRLGLVR